MNGVLEEIEGEQEENTPKTYGNPFVDKELKEVDEMKRSVETYCGLVSLMSEEESNFEVKRLKKLFLQMEKPNEELAAKIGYIRVYDRDSVEIAEPESHYHELISINPKNIFLLCALWVMYRSLENHEKCDSILEDMKSEQSNSPYTLYIVLKSMFHLQKDYKGAIRFYHKNLSVLSESKMIHQYSKHVFIQCHLLLKNRFRYEKLLNEYIDFYREEHLHVWGLETYGYYLLNKYDFDGNMEHVNKAECLFREMGLLNPRLTNYNYLLGRVSLRREDEENELRFYTKELSINPNHRKSLEKRHARYFHSDEFEKAFKDMDHLISKLSPNRNYDYYVSSRVKRSYMLLKMRKIENVEDDLQELLEMKSLTPNIEELKKITMVYNKIAEVFDSENLFHMSLKSANQSIKILPSFKDNSRAYFIKQGCLFHMKKRQEVLDSHLEILRFVDFDWDKIEPKYHYVCGGCCYMMDSENKSWNVESHTLKCFENVVNSSFLYEKDRTYHHTITFKSLWYIGVYYERLRETVKKPIKKVDFSEFFNFSFSNDNNNTEQNKKQEEQEESKEFYKYTSKSYEGYVNAVEYFDKFEIEIIGPVVKKKGKLNRIKFQRKSLDERVQNMRDLYGIEILLKFRGIEDSERDEKERMKFVMILLEEDEKKENEENDLRILMVNEMREIIIPSFFVKLIFC